MGLERYPVLGREEGEVDLNVSEVERREGILMGSCLEEEEVAEEVLCSVIAEVVEPVRYQSKNQGLVIYPASPTTNPSVKGPAILPYRAALANQGLPFRRVSPPPGHVHRSVLLSAAYWPAARPTPSAKSVAIPIR